MKKIFLLSLILFALASCDNQSQKQVVAGEVISEYAIQYAKGFEVKKYEDYTVVSVHNPWDSTKLLHQYILVDREKELPSDLPEGTLVRTPVQNAIAYSNIHCSSLIEIGAFDIVSGVCDLQYMHLAEVSDGIKSGKINDVGVSSNPDIEKIMMIEPEAIFATPIVSMSYGNVEKTKIPIIEAVDYTEPHPLGQAEWLRFYSLFVGKEAVADSLFNITVRNYNEIKDIVAKAPNKPTVFTDLKFQDSWNTPGGKSFMANLLSDAGASFIWKDNNSVTFLPLSFEEVLDKAGEADFWIIKYFSSKDFTYKSLEQEYKAYSHFKAFKEKNVYVCNTNKKSYYVDLPIHPDYILKDMAYVFHPDLFKDYTPRYYTKLQE